MHPRKFFLIGSVALVIATVVIAMAQGPGTGMPNYDPKTETTISGVVDDVQQHAGRHGWTGIHLMLKTDTATVEVHVGPSAYIAQQKFSFAQGDQIQVLGSLVKLNATDALLAREITKDGKTLTLRNAQGIPQWSGGRGPRP